MTYGFNSPDSAKMFYPPKGAAIAEPVWGPIDFSKVLLFRVAV